MYKLHSSTADFKDIQYAMLAESGVWMAYCSNCQKVIAYSRDPKMLKIAERAHRCYPSYPKKTHSHGQPQAVANCSPLR